MIITLNRISGLPDNAKGVATVPDKNEPNRLKVRFPGSPFPGNYDVISTDYTSYTLIYSCQQIIPFLLKYELIWILARERTLSDSSIYNLKGLLRNQGVNVNDFEKTPQTGCQ